MPKVITKAMMPPTELLNVDLELKSVAGADLAPLLEALSNDVLHNDRIRGVHFVTMELYATPRQAVSERYVLAWVRPPRTDRFCPGFERHSSRIRAFQIARAP